MKKSKNNALGAAGVIMMICSFFMRPTATAPSGMPPPDYLGSHMSEAEVERIIVFGLVKALKRKF